jgi:hypothetical protein
MGPTVTTVMTIARGWDPVSCVRAIEHVGGAGEGRPATRPRRPSTDRGGGVQGERPPCTSGVAADPRWIDSSRRLVRPGSDADAARRPARQPFRLARVRARARHRRWWAFAMRGRDRAPTVVAIARGWVPRVGLPCVRVRAIESGARRPARGGPRPGSDPRDAREGWGERQRGRVPTRRVGGRGRLATAPFATRPHGDRPRDQAPR